MGIFGKFFCIRLFAVLLLTGALLYLLFFCKFFDFQLCTYELKLSFLLSL